MSPTADLWQEHKSRLQTYIARRIGDVDAVDDILQDVFIKAHLNLHKVRSPGSITPWLFRIAANAITDYYRSRRPEDQLPEQLAAAENEQDLVAELAGCIEPFVNDLPDNYRAALELSELQGLPQKIVAEKLDISLSGAKSRIQRGRKLLHQRFLDCCEIEVGRRGIVGYRPRNNNCDDDSCS
jgi:RNA polymerase sigma-70 factor (ECF subfamily)